MRPLRIVAPSLALATFATATGARAIEFKDLAGRPLTVDVTNTAVTSYHFDNRNDTADRNVKDRVDDDYFDYVDRLNIQMGYWRFRLNVRLDGQAYANTLDTNNIVNYTISDLTKSGDRVDSNNIIARSNQFLRELNTRYRSGIYPAKLSLVYQQPGLEITAGDFYAQLGRGLVLSLRKVDELAIDTTIRGGKIQASKSVGSFRFGGTLLAGMTNPQRVDESTGRIVTATPNGAFFGFPEPSKLQQFDANGAITTLPLTRPNFQSDAIFGGRLEGGHTLVQVAANLSVVLREDHSLGYRNCLNAAGTDLAAQAACEFTNPVLDPNTPAIAHSQIRTWSGSVNLPQLGKYADLYVEVAGQQLADGTYFVKPDADTGQERADDIGGYAVYANGNVRLGSLSIGLEGKHYRRFFPLLANVSTAPPGFAGPEFSILSYSSPPTAEPIYVEPLGSPNVCNTGGRLDSRYRFNRQAAAFAWAGYYVSYSEFAENQRCEESAKKEKNRDGTERDVSLRTETWDVAVGGDLSFENEKTYAKITLGARTSDAPEPSQSYEESHGHTFYRETYVRYDIVKHLYGPFSVQAQGFHRHRHLPERFDDPWWEGENYLALQWAPRLSGVFGYEYTSQPGCSRDAKEGEFCHFLNGGLTWRALPSDGIWGQIFNSVGVFVGQRRAAIRCVSGVCRQFPAFEGAKLELVSRF